MHLKSAQLEEVDPDTGFSAAYLAITKSMGALLAANGMRVKSGAGTHIVLINAAAGFFESDRSARQLFGRIDKLRRVRNQMAYDGDPVTEAELAVVISDAKALLKLVSKSVSSLDTSR